MHSKYKYLLRIKCYRCTTNTSIYYLNTIIDVQQICFHYAQIIIEAHQYVFHHAENILHVQHT